MRGLFGRALLHDLKTVSHEIANGSASFPVIQTSCRARPRVVKEHKAALGAALFYLTQKVKIF
jgi:hypothetical protein